MTQMLEQGLSRRIQGRLRLRANLVAFYTILSKEILRFARIWVQTILPPAITMSLYFAIFGALIGSRIGPMGGLNYMEFIAPGLIMMAVITNSYSNVASSFYGAKFQRHIEEMLVSPVPHSLILLGFVAGGVARGLAVGGLVTGVGLFYTDLRVEHPLITVAVLLLTASLFSIAGFINGIFANSFDDISIVPTFVLTPLTYLGGVFYSIELLSPFWQQVSMLNPIIYMVSTFRYGILGVSDTPPQIALGLIAMFTLGLFFYAWWLLKRGVGIRQ